MICHASYTYRGCPCHLWDTCFRLAIPGIEDSLTLYYKCRPYPYQGPLTAVEKDQNLPIENICGPQSHFRGVAFLSFSCPSSFITFFFLQESLGPGTNNGKLVLLSKIKHGLSLISDRSFIRGLDNALMRGMQMELYQQECPL